MPCRAESYSQVTFSGSFAVRHQTRERLGNRLETVEREGQGPGPGPGAEKMMNQPGRGLACLPLVGPSRRELGPENTSGMTDTWLYLQTMLNAVLSVGQTRMPSDACFYIILLLLLSLYTMHVCIYVFRPIYDIFQFFFNIIKITKCSYFSQLP